MAGLIQQMITKIISEKSLGDPIIENNIKVKLMMKGIQIDKYDQYSPDEPFIINKLTVIARQLNVKV